MDEFNKDLDEIKNKLNEVKLSDEFKENLKIKMEEELNKPNIKDRITNIIFPRKLVATFACFFLLVTSCVAFADEIESLVANIFSNTDRKIERAIENGNYKKIDMDYVEHDGIGIKVDYIIQEDDTLCIAFNVKSEDEFDDIYFDGMKIENEFGNEIYSSKRNEFKNIEFISTEKKINNKNIIYICKLKFAKINKNEKMNIEIDTIQLFKNLNIIKISNKFIIDVFE